MRGILRLYLNQRPSFPSLGFWFREKKKASAYKLGQGLAGIIIGELATDLFKKFQLDMVPRENPPVGQIGEIICGILWATWIGICKSGLEHSLFNSVFDGMKSMIKDTNICGYVSWVVDERIKEYNDLMYHGTSDYPLLLVSNRFIERVKSVDSDYDFYGCLEVSIELTCITRLAIDTLKAAKEEYEIV